VCFVNVSDIQRNVVQDIVLLTFTNTHVISGEINAKSF